MERRGGFAGAEYNKQGTVSPTPPAHYFSGRVGTPWLHSARWGVLPCLTRLLNCGTGVALGKMVLPEGGWGWREILSMQLKKRMGGVQGNGARRIYSLPGSSAKHHRSGSKDFAGYMPVSEDGRDLKGRGGGEAGELLPVAEAGKNGLDFFQDEDYFFFPFSRTACPCRESADPAKSRVSMPSVCLPEIAGRMNRKNSLQYCS